MAFDLQEVNQVSWRLIQNLMLMRRHLGINNLRDSFPPIERQEMDDLYRSPLSGEALFRGRLAETYKLAKARVDALPHYFQEPSAPKKKSYSQSYNKGGKGTQ